MQATVTDILADLERLSSKDEFQSKFEQTFSDFGFNRFSYFGATLDFSDPAPKIDPAQAVFMSNVSSSFIDHYLENDYVEDDPIVMECMSGRLPVRWTERFRDNARTERATSVMADALDFGIRRGFSVPLHGPRGEVGVFSLFSEENEKSFYDATDRHQHDLHLLALHFHDAVRRALASAPEIPKPVPLTDREVEILQWTAAGKTAWEIGSILNISERTVNFHLHNVMGKFGVHNKTHAAAKAMSFGLIRA